MRTRHFLLPLLALLLGGCGRSAEPVAPEAVELPPATAIEVVRQFERAWNDRDTTRLASLLTDDFEFVFALGDSAAIRPWGRALELQSARHLFVGGGTVPPATRVILAFERTLIALADDRPGRTAAVHKSIFTTVNLTIQIVDGDNQSSLETGGYARFYLVRGDSAVVAGGSDASRWWMERWEDETLPRATSRSMSSQYPTWGKIKRLFL